MDKRIIGIMVVGFILMGVIFFSKTKDNIDNDELSLFAFKFPRYKISLDPKIFLA